VGGVPPESTMLHMPKKGVLMVRKFEHKGHIAYELRKGFVVIKHKIGNKIAWQRNGIRLINAKFIIKRGFWLIRLPFFYFHKNNCGFEIGLPNLFLWIIR
jgi:hypothetical protein